MTCESERRRCGYDSVSTQSRLVCAALAFVGLIVVPRIVTSEGKITPDRVLHLNLRTRVEPFKTTVDWREVTFEEAFPVNATAIIVCDMWDNHWCTAAARRVDSLARTMSPVVDESRNCGILIIHAPSDTMKFYSDYPQRRLMIQLARVDPPNDLNLSDPPLPFNWGCDSTPPDK